MKINSVLPGEYGVLIGNTKKGGGVQFYIMETLTLRGCLKILTLLSWV